MLPAKLPGDETVFSEDTSILFKETRIVRMWDAANRTLVYVAISRRLIDGGPGKQHFHRTGHAVGWSAIIMTGVRYGIQKGGNA